MDEERRVSGGADFYDLLTIAFIVLKLCGVIDWNWVWVFAPLWGSIAIYCLAVVVSSVVDAWRS